MKKKPSLHDRIDALHEAIERLTTHAQMLTTAVDALVDEVQWRNNEDRDRRDSGLPAPITWMPLDPTTDDWHVGRGHAGREGRTATTPSTPNSEQHQSAGDTGESATDVTSLRQLLAAFVVTIHLADYDEELNEVEAYLVEWASREFDHAEFRTSLPADIELPDALRRVRPTRNPQRQLFSDES